MWQRDCGIRNCRFCNAVGGGCSDRDSCPAD